MNIKLSKVKSSKISKVDFSDLGFCKYYTDHMFVCEYETMIGKILELFHFKI